MESIKNVKVEIITGQLGLASSEQREMVESIFGQHTEYKFEIYFHWYNVIHELGHAIVNFNTEPSARLHPVDEEQLVNRFAMSFWKYYGEVDKYRDLCSIVKDTLSRFTPPVDSSCSYIDYARRVWGQEELYNFNNYGWFQFSCVNNAIDAPQTLEQSLKEMGVLNIFPQEKTTLAYQIDDNLPLNVIREATRELRNWGVILPKEVEVILFDDPNCHTCQIKNLDNDI